VAIDDHSTDRSGDILQRYSRQDIRIKVHPSNGHGIIEALRLGYELCIGAYVTRMDSDDIMQPKKLENMIAALHKCGNGHVAVGAVEYFSEGTLGDGYRSYAQWLNELTAKNNNFSDIYRECVIPSPCWMMSREDFETCGGFSPDRYPEDYDLCFRMYQADMKVAGISDVLHLWRDYDTRTSRTDAHYADNRFLDLKIHYFLSIDLDTSRPLILWGAGKKAKYIAQALIQNNIVFHWISNNDKKIGHNIYGKIIESPYFIEEAEQAQIIITVANKIEQKALINNIHQTVASHSIYRFC